MKIVEPTEAAHAAVTPLTLQARRLHTISMMEPGSLELVAEVDRSKEMLQVALQIQAGTAGLHLLGRYGYRGPWGGP